DQPDDTRNPQALQQYGRKKDDQQDQREYENRILKGNLKLMEQFVPKNLHRLVLYSANCYKTFRHAIDPFVFSLPSGTKYEWCAVKQGIFATRFYRSCNTDINGYKVMPTVRLVTCATTFSLLYRPVLIHEFPLDSATFFPPM